MRNIWWISVFTHTDITHMDQAYKVHPDAKEHSNNKIVVNQTKPNG